MTSSAMSPRTADSIEASSRKSAISTVKRSRHRKLLGLRMRDRSARGSGGSETPWFRTIHRVASSDGEQSIRLAVCTLTGYSLRFKRGGKRTDATNQAMLNEGKVVRAFGFGQLLSPKLIEILGEHGEFDALWLDFEHAGLTMKDIELATMAARSYGMDHFVRLPATDYATVMRPLEAGAGGVMISMVGSPAEAEQAVRWAKFWPRGERGLNGGNRDGRFGLMPLAEYTAQANARHFVGIQIETAGALASVAEIAAIPDVDLLFVGPSDLSQVLGVTGEFENPKCLSRDRNHRTGLRRCQKALGRL